MKAHCNDWRKPTKYLDRLGDALELLCLGNRPSDKLITDWIEHTSEELQRFCSNNGPSWAQGIVIIDSAEILANDPVEGPAHEYRENGN